MSKHVININDGWNHKEDSDCPCHPDVITDKDGEIVYIHEDYSRKYPKNGQKTANKDGRLEELKIERKFLLDIHNKLIDKAIDNPKEYAGGIVQELNNGILIRLEYLARTISIMENGSY